MHLLSGIRDEIFFFFFIFCLFNLVAQSVKNPLAVQETRVRSLVWEDPLEKGVATHCSILAWRIPHGQRSPRPWGHKESDTTEQLTLQLTLQSA